MSERVLCERGGLWQPQRVFVKEVVRDFTDGANALATGVGEVVEAFLKSRRRFFSAIFARVFDADLLDSRMRRPANQNSYHQTSPRWTRLMFHSCRCPPRRAARIVLTSRNIFCGPFFAAPSIGTKPYFAYQSVRSR
jgi:hypothetical protein